MYYGVGSRMCSFSCTDPITSKIDQKTSKIFSAEISEKYSYAFWGLFEHFIYFWIFGHLNEVIFSEFYKLSGPLSFAVATLKVGTSLLRRRKDIFVLLNSGNLELLKHSKFTAGKQLIVGF